MFAIAAKGTHYIFLFFSLNIIVLHYINVEADEIFNDDDDDDDQTVVDALYCNTMRRDGFSCSRGGC